MSSIAAGVAANVVGRDVMRTADGVPLKTALARAQRRARLRALLLVAPLLMFVIFSFVIPIANMLTRSVENPQIADYLPRTVAVLSGWDEQNAPGEAVYAALAADMKKGRADKTIGRVARRLNYERSGMRSLFNRTVRVINRTEVGPWQPVFVGVDPEWEQLPVFRLIKRESARWTASYYVAATDRRTNDEGEVVLQPENRRIYLPLFMRTLWISIVITGLTILLGYPVSFLMASLPLRYSNLLMIMVLLPFWTALLVRTTSWIVMLQREGVINDLLVAMGIISDDARILMIFNQAGTIVAMTHILLPFMILPLYAVMRTIPASETRAARSLGANPFTAFRRVYLPRTVSGVGAGSILVFILAIGYYITPALVGGESGQLISNTIAYHMQRSLNWGLGAALGAMLLGSVLILFVVYNRLVGIDKVKFG